MKGLHTVASAALLATALARPVGAADDDLAQRIAACTREQDDARRLACFDRAAAPKVDATQTFGVHGSELARNRDDDQPEAESAPKRISATVTGIEKRARGELVVTLDNGQVWAQKEIGAYFPLKVGDPVAILAGTLGSFRLIAGNRATAVTRVQ
ncbi:MAG TPA: hypothetical protein VL494_15500 [Steroidobacteraceae bacterium]|jgi:hypothetical protein|nr:hypothetical protein [Steroidobacteraceae bacterium]